MNFAVDLTLPLMFLLVGLSVSLALVARPSRSGKFAFADRLRISAAVVRYDFWLDVRGVSRRRRRDLREELRANLDAAAEQVGTAQALAALGSLRRMSAEAVPTATGPRWNTGGLAAAGTFLVVAITELFAIIAWTSAAEASGADRVEGSLPFFPGSVATWDGSGGGFSIAFEPGWLVIAAVAIAFVLGSRPWLAATRRGGAAAV